MLSPSQFTVGSIAEAVGLTWVKPRTKSEHEFLVAVAGGRKMAIFLEPQSDFEAWECSTATGHRGLLVSGVQIEVDEESAFDAQVTYAPYGALVRAGSLLNIASAARDEYQIRRQQLISLIDELPASGSETAAGFLRWQLVIGEGEARRVLKKIEVEPANGPPR